MSYIDPTISLGHLLEAAIVVVAGLGAIYTMRSELKNIQSDVSSIQDEMKKMTEILVVLGRQDERMSALDRRIDDIVHRKGY